MTSKTRAVVRSLTITEDGCTVGITVVGKDGKAAGSILLDVAHEEARRLRLEDDVVIALRKVPKPKAQA